jgi:hypothetical protein
MCRVPSLFLTVLFSRLQEQYLRNAAIHCVLLLLCIRNEIKLLESEEMQKKYHCNSPHYSSC